MRAVGTETEGRQRARERRRAWMGTASSLLPSACQPACPSKSDFLASHVGPPASALLLLLLPACQPA